MSKDNGGPAFPSYERHVFKDVHRGWKEELRPSSGMTLRDYFASNDEGAGDRISDIPSYAYLIADAMLEARDK